MGSWQKNERAGDAMECGAPVFRIEEFSSFWNFSFKRGQQYQDRHNNIGKIIHLVHYLELIVPKMDIDYKTVPYLEGGYL